MNGTRLISTWLTVP